MDNLSDIMKIWANAEPDNFLKAFKEATDPNNVREDFAPELAKAISRVATLELLLSAISKDPGFGYLDESLQEAVLGEKRDGLWPTHQVAIG